MVHRPSFFRRLRLFVSLSGRDSLSLVGPGLLAVAVVVAVGSSLLMSGYASGQAKGKRLYQAECASCHGTNGERIPDAPLASAEFLSSRGDATLIAVITEGKGVMPAFGQGRGGPFDEAQVRAIVAFLSTLAERPSSSVLSDAGLEVFRSKCVRCHGERGDRIPVAPLNARDFLDSRTDADLVLAIAEGRGAMPALAKAHGGSLSDDEIRATVAYLRFTVDIEVAQRIRVGRELYLQYCLSCHGERGDRIQGVSLSSAHYLGQLGDGSILAAVSEGKGAMQGFGQIKGGPFGTPEVTAILAYLKSWAGHRATSALGGQEPASSGRDIYLRHCRPCHGETGDLVAGVQLKSADFLRARTDQAVRQTIVQGNAKGMPAWGQQSGGPFGNEQIDAVLHYLKTVTAPGPSVASPPPSNSSAPSTAPADTAGTAPTGADTALAARGKTVFSQNCVPCHGETRDKVPTCKLANQDWLAQKGDAGLVQAITNGKPPMMPAWAGKVPPDDIKAVVAYLKEAASGESPGTTPGASPASPGSPASPPAKPSAADGTQASASPGRELFTKNCVMCHGGDGMQQPNCRLGSKEWVTNMSEAGLRTRITNGKPGAGMPAWGETKGGPLSDAQITAIIMYLNQGITP